MITVVSGFGRCGTSLMMQMLEYSGIEPYQDFAHNLGLRGFNKGDHPANPGGFYEVPRKDWMTLGWSKSIPDGRAVKIGLRGLPILTSHHSWKVIILERDPMIIRQSYIAALHENFDELFPNWPGVYHRMIDMVPPILDQRRDIEYIRIQFDDLINDPEVSLQRIWNLGIPINFDAIELINRKLYRFAG